MIDQVVIENFRCLRNVDVPLKRLTVLIGENDTGKTTFLEALHLLNRGIDIKNASIDYLSDVWLQQPGPSIVLEQWISGTPSRRVVGPQKSDQPTKTLSTYYYHLPSNGPSMFSSGADDSTGPPILEHQQGIGVPTLIDYFLRRDRNRFDSFVEQACAMIPGLKDIQVATPSPETRRIDLKVEGDLVIDADRSSTGVKLMLFFLALAYHPTPPELVLIEEPESGVHPKRLKEILALLRGLTTHEHSNRPVQVVMSTHSPYLLDAVDLMTDEVLIFQRQKPDGERTVTPADIERIRDFLAEFNLGEVWYNEGEEGLIRQDANP